MRRLAPFVLLMVAACGLDMGGLGADPSDAAGTVGATATGEASVPPKDAATGDRGQGAAPPASDGAPEAGAMLSQDAGDSGAVADHTVGDSGADAVGPDDSGDGSISADSGNADAAILAEGDAGNGSGADAMEAGPPCTVGIPVGWKLAVYDLGSSACPANFTAHDVSGPPVVGAGACSCACMVTADGSCTEGTLTVSGNLGGVRGNGGMCTQPYFTATVSGPDCISADPGQSIPASARAQATLLPPQAGSCASNSQADLTQITMPPATYCEVPAASAEDVCGGAAPAGFAACVAKMGDAPCPLGTPFVVRHVVEDGVSLACSSCSCTPVTTCSNAMVSEYEDPMCQGNLVASFAVDGMCNPTGAPGQQNPGSFRGIQYTVTESTTCTAGSSTATAQVTNPRTLCCR